MRVFRFLLLGLIAAGAFGVSPFLSWVDGRDATSIPFEDLFGVTGDTVDFATSLAVPLLVAAALALIGTVVVSRFLLLLAGVVGLATVIVWMVQAMSDELALGDLKVGAWVALGGGVVALLAAVARGRRARRTRAARPAAAA